MDQFDYLLFELSEQSAVKAPKVVNKIRPWKKMLDLINVGLWLQLFHVFGLFGETIGWFGEYIQPFLACVLLLIAFFIGYSENKYFKVAYWIAWGYLICISFCTVRIALPFWKSLLVFESIFQITINTTVNWLLIYNLSKALERVVQEEGSALQIRNLLKELRFLILSIGLINYIIIHFPTYQQFINISAFVVIMIYIREMRCIMKTSKIMEEQSYSIRVNRTKRKVVNYVAIVIELMITIFLTVWSVQNSFHIQEPVKKLDLVLEQEGYDLKEVGEVRERLISLGMKPNIANDLLPEDVMRFKNIKGLLKSEYVQKFSYAGASFRLTVYMGELFYRQEEDNQVYFDEVLYYLEWLDEPKDYYGEGLTLLQENVIATERNQWIHIAELDNQTVYYDSNIRELQNVESIFTHEVIEQQYLFLSTSLPNATNYRSYIVRRVYEDFEHTNLEIRVSFIKKQKVYPFVSLLEFNHQFPNYWNYLNIEPIYTLALDTSNSFVNQISGLPNYMMNQKRLRIGVDRTVTDVDSYIDEIDVEDIYDDFVEGKKYQHALYIYSFDEE